MRELFLLEEPLNWDDCVPENMRVAWINHMVETLEFWDLLFDRSTRPSDAVPDMGAMLVLLILPPCVMILVFPCVGSCWMDPTLLVWPYARPEYRPFADYLYLEVSLQR